jgi:colanic acid/amylovoran biosynthesis glycosyltransferase
MTIATRKQEYSASGNSATPEKRLPKVNVAYIMSAFPALTETFILYEALAMQQMGIAIELYPLRRLKEDVVHPEVHQLSGQVNYRPFISPAVLRAQLYYMLHRPLAYAKVLLEVLNGTFGSANFFLGAAAIFPKAVLFAYEMERQGINHVHAHFATHPAVAALIIHRLTGIPFSFTAHGSDLHVERRMLEKKVEAAAFAVTISSFNKEIMVQECGEQAREKIHIIHCGIDPEAFPNRPSKNDGGRFQILCVAAFKDVKGHKYLVEACKILHERQVDFICHLIGEGELRSKVEEQVAQVGLQNNFVLHGARPRIEIVRMLAQSDVLALASIRLCSWRAWRADCR